jgi:hypothetical protein
MRLLGRTLSYSATFRAVGVDDDLRHRRNYGSDGKFCYHQINRVALQKPLMKMPMHQERGWVGNLAYSPPGNITSELLISLRDFICDHREVFTFPKVIHSGQWIKPDPGYILTIYWDFKLIHELMSVAMEVRIDSRNWA